MPKDWTEQFFEETPDQPGSSKKSRTQQKPSDIFSIDDPELEARLIAFEKNQVDLEKRLDDIYQKTGLSKKVVADYLDNASNFSPQEWQMIQMRREELKQKIWSMVGLEKKKQQASKEKDHLSKQRKGKTLGARKKWMPMK